MTQEDKQLLLQDLCARLPYGVMVNYGGYDCDYKLTLTTLQNFPTEDLKPYLRPMSSMTEEEKVEYCDLQDKFLLSSQYPVTNGHVLFDWLDKKMFDYRGLIERNLAIDCSNY